MPLTLLTASPFECGDGAAPADWTSTRSALLYAAASVQKKLTSVGCCLLEEKFPARGIKATEKKGIAKSSRMTIGRKASQLAVAIKPAPAARNTTAADGTYDGYIRGVSDLPAAIPNNENHPIIRPIGKTHWKDIPVVRKGRRPSSVLTCLLKSNHPGILDYDGAKVVATEWEHYHAVKDTNGHSVADKIEDAFG
ncbi:uncharacterized protein [Aegilops tauschii subsp. strangulata]|uniref:uncharacterized protein isoform X1 n=1 Tax=Aegilops tauschii subsp. strangulata TaxID=200361 RepID=UPI003CC887BD